MHYRISATRCLARLLNGTETEWPHLISTCSRKGAAGPFHQSGRQGRRRRYGLGYGLGQGGRAKSEETLRHVVAFRACAGAVVD